MSKLNDQIIHIMCETVVFICITFYFTSKHRKLCKQVEELTHRVEEHDTMIQKLLKKPTQLHEFTEKYNKPDEKDKVEETNEEQDEERQMQMQRQRQMQMQRQRQMQMQRQRQMQMQRQQQEIKQQLPTVEEKSESSSSNEDNVDDSIISEESVSTKIVDLNTTNREEVSNLDDLNNTNEKETLDDEIEEELKELEE